MQWVAAPFGSKNSFRLVWSTANYSTMLLPTSLGTFFIKNILFFPFLFG